jgi:hypothetical protein
VLTAKSGQAFVDSRMKEMPMFMQCKDIKMIQSELKRLYEPQLFVELFDFCKGHLDIAGSAPGVDRWCRALFIEILGCAKKHVDWLNMGASRPVDTNADGTQAHNREWLINRWRSIATAKKWDRIRFDPTTVKRLPKSAVRKYKPKRKKQFMSVDEDPDTYIPSDIEE